MPEYLTPGVYIEEIERGPRPIEGVPTSTTAILAETERGATKPRLVTSYKDFTRWFGDVFGDQKFGPYAVNGITYSAVSFVNNSGTAYTSYTYDAQTGILLSATTSTFSCQPRFHG